MTTPRSVNDVTYFIRGITFKPRELVDLGDADAVICMRTKNVQKELDETDLIAVPKRLVRKPELYLQPGDTLISSANSWNLVGKCSYVGTLSYPATAGGFISIVRPKPKTHPRFFFHWLSSPRMQHVVRNLGRQTTNISNLDVSRFKKLDFLEIDYEDQRRIAAILDKADTIRSKREQSLAHADELLNSVFLEMFGDLVTNPRGWPIAYVDDLGDVQGGLQVSKKRDSLSLRLPYLRVANVYRNKLALSEIKEIGLTQAEFRRTKLANGDILIVEGHGNPGEIGRATVWDGSIGNCVHQNHLIRFRPDRTAVSPVYLSRLLNSKGGRLQLIAAGRTTSGLNTISTKKVKDVAIPLPPIEEQLKFESIVAKQAQAVISTCRARDEAIRLFASLSQRAFVGEL